MNTKNTTAQTYSSRIITFILCAALGACANPGKISPQNRAAIRTVQTVNPPKGAQSGLYADATSEAALQAGAQLGLAGLLIGAAIASHDINSEVDRWATITHGQESRVLQLVRRGVEKQFVQTGKLRFAANAPVDAQLTFAGIDFGVRHMGHQRFNAAISATVQLKKPNGQVVWQKLDTATSVNSLALEQYRQNPKAYATGLEEAAQQLAQKIVSAY